MAGYSFNNQERQEMDRAHFVFTIPDVKGRSQLVEKFQIENLQGYAKPIWDTRKFFYRYDNDLRNIHRSLIPASNFSILPYEKRIESLERVGVITRINKSIGVTDIDSPDDAASSCDAVALAVKKRKPESVSPIPVPDSVKNQPAISSKDLAGLYLHWSIEEDSLLCAGCDFCITLVDLEQAAKNNFRITLEEVKKAGLSSHLLSWPAMAI